MQLISVAINIIIFYETSIEYDGLYLVCAHISTIVNMTVYDIHTFYSEQQTILIYSTSMLSD